MRISRLAKLFEQKYGLGLIAKAAHSPKDVFERVKYDILIVYQHWVMGKHTALKMLAENNEPHAKALYTLYNDLVANIDSYSPVQVFNRVNKILALIKDMKANPKVYRQSIHDLVEIKRESDKNYRERLKSGFETNLSNISFGLEKAAKVLRAFVPGAPILGGAVEPQRKELSKDKLLMFMRSPAAQRFGLDNMEIMTQLLSYPELRAKLTTLINAIDRGHFPIDSHEVMIEADSLKQWLDNKKTNLSALEQEPEKPASLFEDEETE